MWQYTNDMLVLFAIYEMRPEEIKPGEEALYKLV